MKTVHSLVYHLVSTIILAFISKEFPIQGQPIDSGSETGNADTSIVDILKWIGKPITNTEIGPKRPISGFIETENEIDVRISIDINHNLTWKASLDPNSKSDDLDIVKRKLKSIHSTRSLEGSGRKLTNIDRTFKIKSKTRARIMYSDKFSLQRGKALLTSGKLDCDSETKSIDVPECELSKEIDLEIRSTETDAQGNAVGVFSQEYAGTNRFKHPRFFSIDNKDLYLYDIANVTNVTSPLECGEEALKQDKHVATYREESMTCFLKNVFWDRGTSFDRSGVLLDGYDLPHYDKADTYDKAARARWIRNQECDIMHTSNDGHLWCKSYENAPGAVLMFRRSKVIE